MAHFAIGDAILVRDGQVESSTTHVSLSIKTSYATGTSPQQQ
jgi:hypothetical protein